MCLYHEPKEAMWVLAPLINNNFSKIIDIGQFGNHTYTSLILLLKSTLSSRQPRAEPNLSSARKLYLKILFSSAPSNPEKKKWFVADFMLGSWSYHVLFAQTRSQECCIYSEQPSHLSTQSREPILQNNINFLPKLLRACNRQILQLPRI